LEHGATIGAAGSWRSSDRVRVRRDAIVERKRDGTTAQKIALDTQSAPKLAPTAIIISLAIYTVQGRIDFS
jgi:hypothetical protein